LLYNINSGLEKQYEYGFGILELLLKEIKSQSELDQTHFIVLIIEAGNDRVNSKVELIAIKRAKHMLEEMQIPHVTSKEIFDEEKEADEMEVAT